VLAPVAALHPGALAEHHPCVALPPYHDVGGGDAPRMPPVQAFPSSSS
jgi:hypothetical protein